jgi:hypothetical protein
VLQAVEKILVQAQEAVVVQVDTKHLQQHYLLLLLTQLQ